jgi:hypothetical protein
VIAVDAALLLRAVEVYEMDRLDFAEATGTMAVASFDSSIERVGTVTRIVPLLGMSTWPVSGRGHW